MALCVEKIEKLDKILLDLVNRVEEEPEEFDRLYLYNRAQTQINQMMKKAQKAKLQKVLGVI